jgi:hypothetical protein
MDCSLCTRLAGLFPLHVLYSVERAVEGTFLAAAAAGLWLKLESATVDPGASGWALVLAPFYAGHGLCAVLDVIIFQRWRRQESGGNMLHRCLRLRGECESAYMLLQHLGLLFLGVLLPGYIEHAMRAAREAADFAAAGSLWGDGSADGLPWVTVEPVVNSEAGLSGPTALGTNVNEGQPVSINVMMLGLWLAWAAEECISVYFDASKPAVPRIANEELRGQLTNILKGVKMRSRGSTFIFNLQVRSLPPPPPPPPRGGGG